jgi:hypothetical protein
LARLGLDPPVRNAEHKRETDRGGFNALRPDDPPPAQQMMAERAGSTVEEVAASHSVYVSQPAAVAAIIEKAASEVRSAAA